METENPWDAPIEAEQQNIEEIRGKLAELTIEYMLHQRNLAKLVIERSGYGVC